MADTQPAPQPATQPLQPAPGSIAEAEEVLLGPVSYTHLTLPTNREV